MPFFFFLPPLPLVLPIEDFSTSLEPADVFAAALPPLLLPEASDETSDDEDEDEDAASGAEAMAGGARWCWW